MILISEKKCGKNDKYELLCVDDYQANADLLRELTLELISIVGCAALRPVNILNHYKA